MPAFPAGPDDVLRVDCRPMLLPDGTAFAIVCADGEVDADSVRALEAALLQALDEFTLVHCDLSGVLFFSAAGVNSLARAGVRAAELGRRLELCGVRGVTRRVLTIAGLDRVLPVSG